ncbi:efflux RND transporter periplasmic adaptor subunit [Thalassotalea crassostreae]|uniref:efflux RND transporter periplasmic adaptor subunit n=1 Tax=Thalassotalea crassostreae TaxID=1763536 RepID=UPI0008392410|nr:efflux RND transporter periplasmic adaptor subunit [Thalassotalea crassostreae]
MTNKTQTLIKTPIVAAAIGIIIGIAACYFVLTFLLAGQVHTQVAEPNAKEEPLYWVAPMDANYRRDKPGKSPMGMDLVPVYANDNSGSDEEAGMVTISPSVVNNLGVRTATAKMQKPERNITTVGYVTYDENNLLQVNPRIEGWIEKLYVKAVGEFVTKGQPLYDIHSHELVNAQEEFLLALQRNNKRLIEATENRLIALQVPLAEIQRLKTSRKLKQNLTFYAPKSGVIESLSIREGYYVQPNKGILVIGDLTNVWVNVEVYERQASLVNVGDDVTMTLDYIPGRKWLGKVDYVYPELSEKTRTLVVRLKFNNVDGKLKPNMFAQVTINSSKDNELLMIPREALIRTGKQDRVVLSLGSGRFKSVEVIAGQVINGHVEILSGLSEGEEVVSSAQFLLDSESSKSSDFKRMASHQKIMSATTTGVINSVMVEHRMVNISRGAIEKWGRDPDTMDFLVAKHIDLTELQSEMNVIFTFEIRDGDFIVIDISNAEESGEDVVDAHSPIDHSSH